MMARWFDKQINNITAAAMIIGVATLISRFLGIVRDRVLASQFGAGTLLDTYYAAFRLPDFIYNLLVVGALSAGFIPLFSHYFCKNNDDKWWCRPQSKAGWRFANNVLNLLIIVFLVAGGVFFIAATPIMKIITPGFSATELATTVMLTRIMFVSQLFFTVSSLFGGILQTFRKFVVYSLAPILYNLGIIIGAIFFVPKFGVNGLAYGVVLGAASHMIIQIWASVKMGFRYYPILDIKDKKLHELIRLMLPRTFSLAIIQLNLFVITIFASNLVAGSLTVFNFANNLVYFPIGIFGISFAVAAFPALAEYVNKSKWKQLTDSFTGTLRKILWFILPLMALFIVLDDQIVRVILGAGNFSWADTIATAHAFRLLCLSLIAQATIPLFSRLFYAYKNTRDPLIGAIMNLLATFIGGWLLSARYGLNGLVIGFTVGSYINLIYIVLVVISKKYISIDLTAWLKYIGVITLGTLLLGIVTQTVKELISPLIDFSRFGGIFLHGAISGTFGIIVYLLISHWFKLPEYEVIHNQLKEKVNKFSLKIIPTLGHGDENDLNY